jgi:hypothetical protein
MSKNDITGDKIQTKSPSKAFDEGFDRIFGKSDNRTHEDRLEAITQLLDSEVLKSAPIIKPTVPKGYTAEELERDNPYNQWMYENAEPSNADSSSE